MTSMSTRHSKRKFTFIWATIIYFNIFNFHVRGSEIGELQGANPCQSQSPCNKCILSPGCGWCTDDGFKRGIPRCDFTSNLIKRGCGETSIINPENSLRKEKNVPVSSSERHDDDDDETKETLQISPQELNIKLRQNQPVLFNVTFRQAANYPVDLYYLMDLTSSMKEHKDKLAELADAMAASMHNITKNFRLGFGSFIDKIVMPYADMQPKRLENPCRDYTCSPGYGFKNHLPLDIDVRKFTNEVAQANLSGNLDNAEGGFDAIMQAIVCKDHLKWSLFSRKIILFATDSIFHYAGDGKLGGIVKPNDGLCHLDSSGYYTESVFQDYPSLSQIASKVRANRVNLIFAVPEERVPLYKKLSSHIEGAYTGKLSGDSSNIVHLIRDQYEQIRSEVVMKDDAKNPVSLKYTSKCLSKTKEFENSCSGLQLGDTVTFEVRLELTNCPKDLEERKRGQTVTISPVGLTEGVKLNLEFLCDCDCEEAQKVVPKSSKCSQNGTYSCGICKCDANHFGSHCECAGDDVIRDDLRQLCRKEGMSNVCSAKGDCVCGKCDCYTGPRHEDEIYGQFCECDTFSCERDSEGRVCGGPERGKCCNDDCVCQEGWTGPACECSADKSSCISPGDEISSAGSGRVCNGHGSCHCGKCQCLQDERGSRYVGPFCEDCNTCEGLCSHFRSCVECQVFNPAIKTQEECGENCHFVASVVDFLVDSSDERKCVFKDSLDCTFEFQYSYDVDNVAVVRVKKEKDCPKEANLMYIGVGVGSAVFVVGLIALLIVRFFIYMKDKKDYKKFMDEVNNVQWAAVETNPLFKEAVTNFPNPLFMPKSEREKKSVLL